MPVFFTVLALLLALAYGWIILRAIQGWQLLPAWNVPAGFTPKTPISILIPARNEAGRISACLHSILAQDYPLDLLEVLVLDDFSEDTTAAEVLAIRHPALRLLALADFSGEENMPGSKKRAVEIGVREAKGELILATDADCEVHPQWLRTMVSYYETHQPVFMAAPVNFYHEQNALERFQSLDMLGMLAITGDGIYRKRLRMSNGANMAYQRAAFWEVQGFEGNRHLASGDDIFLIQKMAAHYPDRIGFVKAKEAAVFTRAMPDLRSFFQQRLRWSTKNASYPEWKVILTLSVIFFLCWGILLAPILAIWLGPVLLWVGLGLLGWKSFIDYWHLRTMALYFGRSELMRSFIPAQLMHITYIAVVGLLGNVRKQYHWKGRKVR